MGNQDMLMRLEDVERLRREAAKGQANSKWSGDGLGVALDKNARPPRLFGMTELPLDSVSDVRALIAALATRNTAGTLINDSSSRSHCFAFLTLRAYDATDDAIRTSRFQFVDLAGSSSCVTHTATTPSGPRTRGVGRARHQLQPDAGTRTAGRTHAFLRLANRPFWRALRA